MSDDFQPIHVTLYSGNPGTGVVVPVGGVRKIRITTLVPLVMKRGDASVSVGPDDGGTIVTPFVPLEFTTKPEQTHIAISTITGADASVVATSTSVDLVG